jgi:hypothetical protein
LANSPSDFIRTVPRRMPMGHTDSTIHALSCLTF